MFQPNLVSNTVFLLSVIQCVSFSIVNYKGRPYMAGVCVFLAVCICALQ